MERCPAIIIGNSAPIADNAPLSSAMTKTVDNKPDAFLFVYMKISLLQKNSDHLLRLMQAVYFPWYDEVQHSNIKVQQLKNVNALIKAKFE